MTKTERDDATTSGDMGGGPGQGTTPDASGGSSDRSGGPTGEKTETAGESSGGDATTSGDMGGGPGQGTTPANRSSS